MDYCFESMRSPESLQLASINLARGGWTSSIIGKNDMSGYLKKGEVSFNFEIESQYNYKIMQERVDFLFF